MSLTTIWNVAIVADRLNKARLERGIPGRLAGTRFVLDVAVPPMTGRYVVRLVGATRDRQHAAAVIDGTVHGSWDSRGYAVLGYYSAP
jgi:hypothetical protein